MTYLPRNLFLTLLLTVIVLACSAEGLGQRDRRDTSGSLGAVAPAASECPTTGYTRLVEVGSPDELSAALKDAQPGDLIRLASGRYGKAVIRRSGTAEAPIILCGPRTAVLDGGNVRSGYVLYLDGVSHWQIRGITVTNGQKGVMLDATYASALDGIEVHHVGMEAVHFRTGSTGDTIRNSHIHHTGRVGDPHYGEGVYIGSSVNNAPEDPSHDIVVLDNLIEDVTAEAVEAKESSRRAIVRGNTIRRTGDGNRSAAAAVGTRGGDGLFEHNRIAVEGSLNGFQVYSGGGPGDGDHNVFRSNTITLGSRRAWGISVARDQSGNVVDCDNVVAPSQDRLTNIDCTR